MVTLEGTIMGISRWLCEMLEDGTYRSTYHMADAFGTNEPNIVRWKKGQVTPSVPSCIKMAEATGRPVEEIAQMAALDALERRDARGNGSDAD